MFVTPKITVLFWPHPSNKIFLMCTHLNESVLKISALSALFKNNCLINRRGNWRIFFLIMPILCSDGVSELKHRLNIKWAQKIPKIYNFFLLRENNTNFQKA